MSHHVFQDFYSIWKELVSVKTEEEATTVVEKICESLGAKRVTWTDRHFNLGRETSIAVMRKSHCLSPLLKQHEDELEEAYLQCPMPAPDYRDSNGYYGKIIRDDNLMCFSEMPRDNRHFHKHLINSYEDITRNRIGDLVLVPLSGLDIKRHISTINFMLDDPMPACLRENFHLASNMLRIAWNHSNISSHIRPVIALSQKERRVATWAIAGKTMDEISMITSIPTRTVRHYLYSIRDRYGYATVQQMLIRVAKDFNIDP